MPGTPTGRTPIIFEKRVPLPKGSTVKVVAHFDNSAHPRNPHCPPKLVTWGPEVTDEMCVGYIGVVKKGQDLTRPAEKDDLFEILARQYLRKRSPRASRQEPAVDDCPTIQGHRAIAHDSGCRMASEKSLRPASEGAMMTCLAAMRSVIRFLGVAGVSLESLIDQRRTDR